MSNTPTRRLSAIVFADIAGYTALMQEDEGHAVRSRDRFRDVLANAMHMRRGEAVQHYGDGTLSVFESAVEAAESAVEVQKALRTDLEVPLRIGIHVGDIVRDAEGVYGNGVNVAARIQALATPGSVLVSERVADELRNHPYLPVRFLGEHELKNVVRPVGVYALEASGIAVPKAGDLHQERRASSVAVLPFVNMSSSVENEHFSDGITEEIINVLTKIAGLKVTSRTSSFSFKGTQKDLREIADALDVQHVLEGSVRIAGDRVRVTAQLIDAATDTHLFSETYDRSLKDVFAIQDEIAEGIAHTLQKTLVVVDSKPRGGAPTTDLESYNLYLKGRHHWNRWSPEAVQAAIKYYRMALERAPDFAAAHAGLAVAYCFLGAVGRLPASEAYPAAEAAGERAAELDPGSAEAQLALGLAALFNSWDSELARKHLEVARGLNPGLVDVRQYYGIYHMLMGNHSAALMELQAAAEMDPLSLPINNQLGDALNFSGQYTEALQQYDHTLELNPVFRAALEGKGWSYLGLEDLHRALESFEAYSALSPTQFAGAGQLGYVHARLGNTGRAIEYQQRLEERERADPHTNVDVDFALLYLGLKKFDWAFARLERAVEKRLGGVVFLGAAPMWRQVAEYPRFQAILDSIGLWSGDGDAG